MTIHANPYVMTKVATYRGAELLAQADRDRLAQRVERNGARSRQQWPDLMAAVAVVAALTLVLAGSAAAQEPPPQTQHGLAQVEDQPEASAVQKVREAAR